MNTAIYPGTFDPITYGHIDVIRKSLKIFDRVIVATTDNINKNYHFSIEDRLSIIHNSLFKDLKLNNNKIKVISFDDLTIDLSNTDTISLSTMYNTDDMYYNSSISFNDAETITITGNSIDDATPEEWDQASKKAYKGKPKK